MMPKRKFKPKVGKMDWRGKRVSLHDSHIQLKTKYEVLQRDYNARMFEIETLKRQLDVLQADYDAMRHDLMKAQAGRERALRMIVAYLKK